MSKYTPLEEFLKRQSGDSVELTFGKIERIIGDNLPPSARQYFNSWDNTPGSPLEDSWLNADWKTVMVDIENEKVKLRRIRSV